MSELLTYDEIKARYAPDWVVISEPQVDESLEVLAGRVAFHSPDRDAVYRKATEMGLDSCAFRFLGEIHGETIGLLIEIEPDERPVDPTRDHGETGVWTMDEALTFDEIKARYAPEWVLIVEPRTDEHHNLLGGRVVFHSPEPDAVYTKAGELPIPRHFAVRWTGEYPAGMEFLL